jgi:hypothetical protein
MSGTNQNHIWFWFGRRQNHFGIFQNHIQLCSEPNMVLDCGYIIQPAAMVLVDTSSMRPWQGQVGTARVASLAQES